jgi:hypothetical protein
VVFILCISFRCTDSFHNFSHLVPDELLPTALRRFTPDEKHAPPPDRVLELIPILADACPLTSAPPPPPARQMLPRERV